MKKDQLIANAITSLEQINIAETGQEESKNEDLELDYIVSCSETSQGVKR